MSEPNLFDPDTFTVSSALNGVQGTIREPLFIRSNYNGKAEETTALHFLVIAPNLEKPRDILISFGNKVQPSEDRKTPALAGEFLVGAGIDKRSNGARFLNALYASGFSKATFAEKGSVALDGATFTWKAEDRSWKDRKTGKMRESVDDLPAKFEGYEGQTEVAAPVDNSALVADVTAALLGVLATEPEISRGQLSIKVGPALKAHPQRVQALALLLQDSFLASVPGVTFDKKTVKKA